MWEMSLGSLAALCRSQATEAAAGCWDIVAEGMVGASSPRGATTTTPVVKKERHTCWSVSDCTPIVPACSCLRLVLYM